MTVIAPAATSVTPAAITEAETAPVVAAPETSVEPPAVVARTPEEEVSHWKAMAKLQEGRAKEGKTAIDRLAELEAEKLTETERLQKQLADLTAERDTAAAASVKTRVAASKGVDETLLTGSTEEELNSSADALLAWRGVPEATTNDAAASGTLGAPVGAGHQLTSTEGMSPVEIVQAKADGRLDKYLGKR
jgi:hypothetical protein